MPEITFHDHSGAARTTVVEAGTSLMRAALDNAVPGIIGECGGQAMCATCHVYVRDLDGLGLPEATEDEDEMLECTVDERLANSRLGCQVVAGRDFGRIEVDVAEHQV